MVEIETFIPILIAFGLGIVSGVVVNYFQNRFSRPVITIKDTIIRSSVQLRSDDDISSTDYGLLCRQIGCRKHR